MYVDLHGRCDYLGANITFYISQLILAKNHGLHIKIADELPTATPPSPSNPNIKNSIFVKTLFDIIRNYDAGLQTEVGDRANVNISDGLLLFSLCVLQNKMDMFSYFKQNFPEARALVAAHALAAGYTLPFDPAKTILVHLRLMDVKGKPDYDGSVCSGYVANKLNSGQVFREGEIAQPFNHQCPIPQERLQKTIDRALAKNPGRKVILITNPGEDLSSWPYESISSKDESYDLYLLCKAEVAVFSRSSFPLCTLFFTEHKDVYVPLWGCTACMGLNTNYQQQFEGLNFFV